MDSYGGWIGAPVDYLEFLLAIDGQRAPRLLGETSVREMLARPRIPGADDRQPVFYGLGVYVTAPPGKARNWWHGGDQPGVKTLAVRTARGHSWVAAFNSNPRDRAGFFRKLDASLWKAANQVAQWPASSESCGAYERN
jgi:hypothetical protein